MVPANGLDISAAFFVSDDGMLTTTIPTNLDTWIDIVNIAGGTGAKTVDFTVRMHAYILNADTSGDADAYQDFRIIFTL